MPNMIMNVFAVIVNSIIVNAVLGLIVNVILVALLSVLLGLVLVISVNSIVWFVKNSISIKAMMRMIGSVQSFLKLEVGVNP